MHEPSELSEHATLPNCRRAKRKGAHDITRDRRQALSIVRSEGVERGSDSPAAPRPQSPSAAGPSGRTLSSQDTHPCTAAPKGLQRRMRAGQKLLRSGAGCTERCSEDRAELSERFMKLNALMSDIHRRLGRASTPTSPQARDMIVCICPRKKRIFSGRAMPGASPTRRIALASCENQRRIADS